MSRQFAFPMLGAMAALVSFIAIPTSSASAAETCIAAPTQPAPQGSHWKYRLERATQRKCWRLVKLEPQGATKQAAAAPDPADEPDAAPPAGTPAARVPSPQHGWLTRSASAVPDTIAPAQATPDRASEPVADQATAPPPVSAAPPPVPVVQEIAQAQAIDTAAPVAPAAPVARAAEPAGSGMTQFVFLAIAGFGLLAAAIFALVELRRRRTDVLTRIAHDDITSFEEPEFGEPEAEDAPTFSAMPPMRLIPQHDDIDEALRRSRRRRMAA